MTSDGLDARILIVDDESMIRDLLCSYLEDYGYACEMACGVDDALAQLSAGRFDMIISDLHMPERTGLELLAEVSERYPRVAFLMATGAPDTHVAVEAMRHGAVDFLVKPLDLKRVQQTVHDTVVRMRHAAEVESQRRRMESLLAERTEQLTSAMQRAKQASAETMQALAMALDVRARDVAGHSLRVSRYGSELARRMGYSREDLSRFEHASYLHDIGKLGIPDAILNKPGSLDPDEQVIMRNHVQIGFELVTQVQSLAPAAELILAHQEHFDGSGYPRGLKGEEIPLDARVFAVADTLDAMTSDRPYRNALSWDEARDEILRQSGRQFDPRVVEAFLQVPAERWIELQAGIENAPAAPIALAIA